MILSIGLLAISLSLDALSVGLSYGLRNIKIPLFSKIIICFLSILYSGASLLLGISMSNVLPQQVSKFTGISILIFMGLWIIIQALSRRDDNNGSHKIIHRTNKTLFRLGIKSLGITIEVIKDPAKGDIDSSGDIDFKESILLGLALSVDAIGVGIGSALAGFYSLFLPITVGLFQMFFLYIGTFLGVKVLSHDRLNKKVLTVLPGVLLIILALIRI